MQLIISKMCFKSLITVLYAVLAVLINKGETLSLSGSNPGEYALIAQSFTFHCEIDGGVLSDTVQFMKNGSSVCDVYVAFCTYTGSYGYKCGCDANRYMMYLKIQDVDETDEAIWTCYSSEHSNAVNLEIYRDLDAVVLSPSSLKSVHEGEDLEPVTCSAHCRPACSFTWYKENTPANIISSVNGVLKLQDLKRTASGSYFCKATHSKLNKSLTSSKLDLNVNYGPDPIHINLTDHTSILERETLKPVSCFSDCNPPCSIGWYKDQVNQSKVPTVNGILKLTDINRSQSGRYVCKVSHTISLQSNIKGITIDVQYQPDRVNLNPTKLEPILEGGDIMVQCTVNCNPTCLLSWYKDVILPSNLISSHNGVLELSNVNRTQSGNYICQAVYNVTGIKLNSSPIHLLVHYPPNRVNLNPTELEPILEGGDIMVQCTVNCNPTCLLSWYKDVILPSNLISSHNGVLELSNVNRTQSGNYICQAVYNVTGIKLNSSSIHLLVHYPPDRVNLNPTELEPILEGGDIMVQCTVNCNPTCVLSWYKDVILPSNLVSSHNGVLELSNVNRTQSGNYICQAVYNVTGIKLNSSSIHLLVHYGPDDVTLNLQTTSIGVMEGEDVDPITCKAECNPTCSFSWYKQPNSFVTKENIFQLKDSRRSQSGSYFCQAYNNVTGQKKQSKLIDIDVYYGPINITLFPMSLHQVSENSNISLTCSAECNPDCNYQWYKETATDAWTEGNQLNLFKVNRTETGMYFCRVSNPRSSTKHQTVNVSIDVIFPPELTTWTRHEEIDKDTTNVTMYCETTSNPPATVSWFDNVGGESIGIGNQYMEQDLTCEDRMNYSCVADNGVGSPVSSQFSLFVPCSVLSTSPTPTTKVTNVFTYLNTTIIQSTLNPTASAGHINEPGMSALEKGLIPVVVVLVIIIVGIIVFLYRKRQKARRVQELENGIELKDDDHTNTCTNNHVDENQFDGIAQGNGSLSIDISTPNDDEHYNRGLKVKDETSSQNDEHSNHGLNQNNSQTLRKHICSKVKGKDRHIYDFAEESHINTQHPSKDSVLMKSKKLLDHNKQNTSATSNGASTSLSATDQELELFNQSSTQSGSSSESSSSVNLSAGSSALPYKSTQELIPKDQSCSCHDIEVGMPDGGVDPR